MEEKLDAVKSLEKKNRKGEEERENFRKSLKKQMIV